MSANNTELHFSEKLTSLFNEYPKVRSDILSLHRKSAKNGNPYKSDHNNTSKLIKSLQLFIEDYKNSGIEDYQSQHTYKRAQLELARANRRLTLHNMYVQKHGIQKSGEQFHTSLTYRRCISDAELYEKQLLIYCLESSGFKSVLDYDLMTSLFDSTWEFDWLRFDHPVGTEEEIQDRISRAMER
jgi:hypothetical protein